MSVSGSARNWQLVKEEQGIKVYQASVVGSDYKEYRLETTVEASLSTLVAVNSDAPHMHEWMDAMESNKQLSGDEQRYITHTKTKVPWPAKNRDAVVETWIEQDPATLQVTMTFQGANNVLPIHKDYERLNCIKGFWQFTPQAAGRVSVVYQNHAEAGGKIPGWIANMFGVDVPFNSVKNMLKEIKKERYKKAQKSFIKEPSSA